MASPQTKRAIAKRRPIAPPAQYLPVAPPMFALLAGALAILLILIQVRVLRFAYMQLGVSSGTAFFLLLGSLLGGYINIELDKSV